MHLFVFTTVLFHDSRSHFGAGGALSHSQFQQPPLSGLLRHRRLDEASKGQRPPVRGPLPHPSVSRFSQGTGSQRRELEIIKNPSQSVLPPLSFRSTPPSQTGSQEVCFSQPSQEPVVCNLGLYRSTATLCDPAAAAAKLLSKISTSEGTALQHRHGEILVRLEQLLEGLKRTTEGQVWSPIPKFVTLRSCGR
jgi:hypothetical protein